MDATYTMDVDDLFGDSEHVTLQSITATPPVKGLARRVDELGANGCCQKIAWSKNGCVACISPDGHIVNLKVFSRDTETGKWDLRKDVPIEIPQGRDEFPFVHVSWSHLGNDLAIMDTAGRVMIFSCAMALDRMHFIRAELGHPEAEVDTVVGMQWLAIHPYEQKNHIAWSTTREGNKWKWNMKSHVFHDMFHPVDGKASLIYLKRYGELKLRFQQNDSSWQEVSTQLGPMLSTKEPFTHAAFASNNDKTLLLAAYDIGRRLYLYRVEAHWDIPPPEKRNNNVPFEKPTLQASLLSIEEDCLPTNIIADDLNNGARSIGVAAAQLTHLSFLPATPEQNDGSLPTIQAIFCRPPNIIQVDQMQPQENPHSVIVKWEVHKAQQNQLHPSWDQVTSKKKSVSSVGTKNTLLLKRQSDFTLHTVVLSTYSFWYHMLLAFCYSDGTIEIRKRTTMELIVPDGNSDNVTSLLQAGFAFPHAESSLHVTFSPNHCAVVCMQEDGNVKLRFMDYQHGSLSNDEDDDPRHSAALASLVLQSASAANQYYSSDDIFSIIGPLSEKRKLDFTNLLFDGLQVNIDCGVDDMSQQHLVLLGRSPFFVKTLSAMNLLGLQGITTRSLPSKMAWIVLNIKYVTQILTTITRMHGQIEKVFLRPEVVPQFIGICRWVMHFMAFILSDLFTLGRALQDTPPADLTRDLLERTIQDLKIPAVLLLLSAFPRAMMRLWSQPITWVKRSAEQYTNSAAPTPTPELRRLYTPLQAAVSEVPFEWRWFEILCTEIHGNVRQVYKSKNLNETQRNNVERELLSGRIPDILFPVAKKLVTDTLFNDNGCLADKMDEGRLMFFDTTWLGFSDTKTARTWHACHVVDVCQKIVIRGIGTHTHPGAPQQTTRSRSDSIQGAVHGDAGQKRKPQLRQCVRCGACMEDVMQDLPGYGQRHASWLMGVAKHCVCGNSWMLATDEKSFK